MKALFVVNARAGRRRGFDVAAMIRRVWPHEQEIVACGAKGELDALIDRAEAGGVGVVFAVGGDGTVHETAKRLIGRAPALGILPLGSGNGFARHIGLPVDPAAALASCGGGRIVTIDTATVNEQPFIGVMGIGFDALVAERFASSTTRGLETYVREGLRAFSAYKAEEYELELPQQTLRHRAFVLAIANSSQYGNNARVAPLASLQDGLLDVVIVGEPSVVETPLLLARLFTGSFDRSDLVVSLKAPSVTIRRAGAGPAHLDGEPVHLPAELDVKNRPMSLRLLVGSAERAI